MKSVDFTVRNPHVSVDFTEDFKDFTDLMKHEDLPDKSEDLCEDLRKNLASVTGSIHDIDQIY